MRTANEVIRLVAHRAMECHGLREQALSGAVGCSPKTIHKILSDETVHLTQEQVFNLLTLGGIRIV